MRRGDIYLAAARGAYTGKPRPLVVIQDHRFDATASITVCLLTSDPIEAPLIRLPIRPTETNGLEHPSRVMIDKVTTVPREALTERIGHLTADEIGRVNASLVVFLGLAG